VVANQETLENENDNSKDFKRSTGEPLAVTRLDSPAVQRIPRNFGKIALVQGTS
jgi:hypothetical protein